MKSSKVIFAAVVLAISYVYICKAQNSDEDESTTKPPELKLKQNETLHLFLLAIPDSVAQNLERQQDSKYRQEDTNPLNFAQTGQYLGQIIQGVLGGDFRPIFAGSLGFVEESQSQANLQRFFGNIAPGLNLALREIYTRAQNALGLGQRTTPQPAVQAPVRAPAAPVANQSPPRFPVIQHFFNRATPAPVANNQAPPQVPIIQQFFNRAPDGSPISPSDFVVVQENGIGLNRTVMVYFGHDLPGQQAGNNNNRNQPLNLQAPERVPPTSTTSWQYVLNQINSQTTTVEPLPLITRTTAAPAAAVNSGEDEDAKRERSFKNLELNERMSN